MKMLRPHGLFRGLAMLAAGLSLSACGFNLINVGPAPNLYDLSPTEQFSADMPKVHWQLVIEDPEAPNVIDTDHILARSSGYEVKYIARARWTDRAPRLVQTLLVHAFDKSGAIVGVGRQAIGLRSDYSLKSELQHFEAVYSGLGPPKVRVVLNLKIVRQPADMIVAGRTFQVEEQVQGTSMRAIAATFQDALGKVFSEVVPWTLTSAQVDYVKRLQERRSPKPMRPGGVSGAMDPAAPAIAATR